MKTLRVYIAVILAITFIGITFQSAFIQISYDLNKGFISQELCVNKDKPNLNCEGKCYLKKQLNKAQDQKEECNNSQSNKLTISWSVADMNVTTLGLYQSHHNTLFAEVICIPSSFVKEIEHPPA